MRVGGDEPVPVNVRLIAASNRVPRVAVESGKLREDLYYRIHVFPIVLPPLRERDGDALLLAQQFLDALNAAHGASKRLGSTARRRIAEYPWRGNVRELKNELQRAFILCESVIEFPDLEALPTPATASQPGLSLAKSEQQLILGTLEQCGGDKKKAALILGISLKTLYTRLHLYAPKES